MFSSDELVIDQCIIIEIVAILKGNEECILYIREGKGILVSKLFDFVNFNGCKNLRKLSDGLGIYRRGQPKLLISTMLCYKTWLI